MEIGLSASGIPGDQVTPTEHGWRLDIPAGTRRAYRLAQLDDYSTLKRSRFQHVPPQTLSLRARLSGADLPGTWGFGFWNDPLGLSLGFGNQTRQLPVLPQVAWFMHASPPNWLVFSEEPSARTGQPIPANGFFAATIRSRRVPTILFAPGILALPLLALRPVSRFLRRLASRLIRQEAAQVETDVTEWHEYSIHWLEQGCQFNLDGKQILSTPISPHPPLGLVIWIDNQFAAWTPEGRLGYGVLENPLAWLEIEKVNFLQE